MFHKCMYFTNLYVFHKCMYFTIVYVFHKYHQSTSHQMFEYSSVLYPSVPQFIYKPS